MRTTRSRPTTRRPTTLTAPPSRTYIIYYDYSDDPDDDTRYME
jgi:hypothetical protein